MFYGKSKPMADPIPDGGSTPSPQPQKETGRHDEKTPEGSRPPAISPKPTKWQKRWIHIIDVLSSFNPFIDAARKHAIYIEEHESEGFDVKKAWYRFSFFVIIAGGFAFAGGCEIQEHLDQKSLKAQPPDQEIKNQLDETNRQKVEFQKNADYWQSNSGLYLQNWIDALKATNSFPVSAALQTAIDIVEREQSNSANNVDNDSLQMQQSDDLEDLQAKSDLMAKIEKMQPVIPLWRIVFSQYQDGLVQAAKKCTNNYIKMNFPAMDFKADNPRLEFDFPASCGWKCHCLIQASPEFLLQFAWTGNKSKSSDTYFTYHEDGTFRAQLNVAGRRPLIKECSISDMTNCIKNMNLILRLSKDAKIADMQ